MERQFSMHRTGIAYNKCFKHSGKLVIKKIAKKKTSNWTEWFHIGGILEKALVVVAGGGRWRLAGGPPPNPKLVISWRIFRGGAASSPLTSARVTFTYGERSASLLFLIQSPRVRFTVTILKRVEEKQPFKIKVNNEVKFGSRAVCGCQHSLCRAQEQEITQVGSKKIHYLTKPQISCQTNWLDRKQFC